ncbi:ABC transporter substrate-binding protein [Neobacillus citreus]|uniref:ABC transporter substrate-binding protein n=1 Tax=Neobacillus citreus TaxID=2833578 RepID=A0A942T3B6_9BACI|nr:ABC transporter substrate-binding protein [Neobacillus citreus]MCH6264316.1 ABC transporter substrate-binding protein [Neobacillus citreus]
MKKVKKIFMVFTILAVLVIAGCSGNKSTANKSKEKGNTSGGTLIYGRATDTVTLDPHNLIDAESSRISKNIFETLIDYKKDGTEVVPKLAKEWTVSDDGKVWTFKLQENVKFHDGTDFNAEAVVYNFQRMMDDSHPQHKGDFSIFNRTFKGVIQEVKAPDEHTVEFILTAPNATFLPNLGITTFGIISPAALKEYGDNIKDHPVGTGPFKFVEWKPNDSVTLEKNDKYRVAGLPKLDKLMFKVIPDNSSRLTALKNGEIDLMDGINQSDLSSIEKNDSLQIFKRPAGSLGYLTFNLAKPPFDNVKVRQAINYAINKKGIIDTFYGPVAKPAKNMLPPFIWGYNDDVKGYEYNPEKAKALLAEAGFAGGFETEFSIMSTDRSYFPQPTKVAEAIKSDLAKIGITVKIVNYEWATYLSKLVKGEYAFAGIGRISENGDPDNFLFTMLSSESVQNRSAYKNEKVDELLRKAQTTIDKEERTKLYKEVQEIVYEDAPTIPLAYVETPLAGAAYVKGYVPHAIGYESLAEVYIEK